MCGPQHSIQRNQLCSQEEHPVKQAADEDLCAGCCLFYVRCSGEYIVEVHPGLVFTGATLLHNILCFDIHCGQGAYCHHPLFTCVCLL